MDEAIARLRQEYLDNPLDEDSAGGDPFPLFRRWFDEAGAVGIEDRNIMTLATVTSAGSPRARAVLLKDLDARGFVFYTNHERAKATELAARPEAALVFVWHPLERSVRIEGAVERVTAAEADAYFAVRPRGSQLGAWASAQSSAVPGREALERSYAEVAARFEGTVVPRPEGWGGYRVLPHTVEFWQGRRNRLHDRLRFERSEAGWSRVRLAP